LALCCGGSGGSGGRWGVCVAGCVGAGRS
jgi:hypothetical protein